MSLPEVSRILHCPGAALLDRFREIGLTREFIRAMTLAGDNLRAPLTLTRPARFMDEPAAFALRLFFCAEPIEAALAAEALGMELLSATRDAGLLIDAGAGRVRAPFHLRTVQDLYLFSDYLNGEPEAVMGAGETTAILFHAGRPSNPVGTALDLGCGAGTLALLLSSDAGRVIGTDINPRAVALAQFNAAANGRENVEFREGDVYAPVEGERFDVIVSQPPYYPGAGQVFLHGGLRGDELAVRVVTGMLDHLTPAGRGVVFTSWPEDRAEIAHPSMRLLELHTSRRELSGTRQAIDIIEHAPEGEGWSAAFEAPADRWGNVDTADIDRLIAATELLRGPREALLGASLNLPKGAVLLEEDAQLYLNCPADSLVGVAPIDQETWAVMAAVDAAPDVRTGLRKTNGEDALPVVARCLERGLLTVAG
ncbi:MAG: methyltransferase [Bryobacteraceae bacterium]